MSSEIKVEGDQYVLSKRASKLSGYTQDYIGQLARGGYISAKRVGGLWYISMESLIGYKENAINQQTQTTKVLNVKKPLQEENKPSLRDNEKRDESLLTYLDDSDRLLLPDIHKVTTHHISDQDTVAKSHFQTVDTKDKEGEQNIPIHKKESVGYIKKVNEKSTPPRFQQHSRPSRKSMSYVIFPAVLTIIIILSFGLSSLRDNSKYTVKSPTNNDPYSANNSFLATAYTAKDSFEKLGSVIEDLFVAELIYKRSQ